MGRPRENKKAVPYDPAFCLVRRPRTGGGTFFYGKALQGREDHAFDILNEESEAHTGNNRTSKARLQRCHIDDFPDPGCGQCHATRDQHLDHAKSDEIGDDRCYFSTNNCRTIGPPVEQSRSGSQNGGHA